VTLCDCGDWRTRHIASVRLSPLLAALPARGEDMMRLHAAASLRPALTDLAAAFTAASGIKVERSSARHEAIGVTPGDVYYPCHHIVLGGVHEASIGAGLRAGIAGRGRRRRGHDKGHREQDR
jgi:hypothetical protein